MTEQDPFSTLGMSPSSDVAAIKRAYFAALIRNPPHGDAEAFRRVRGAYELLCNSEARGLAILRAPLDTSAELAAFEAEWGERLRRCAGRAQDELSRQSVVEAFIERLSKLAYADLTGAGGS